MGRRLFTVIGLILVFTVSSTAVYANIDNLSNLSAEWIRTGNRNAATDAADIVFYNPAGLTELSDGFHLNVSNQTLIRKPQHTFDLGLGGGVKSYEQDSPDYFLPNTYLSYNKDKWSVFGGIYIPGGGAVVDYPDGSITTELAAAQILALDPGVGGTATYSGFPVQKLEASSMYLTTTLGGAYEINDLISVAAGFRYINAKNTIKASVTGTLTDNAIAVNTVSPGRIPETYAVEWDETADGFGGIFGVNVNATDKLNLALQYQSGVKLDFKTKEKRDDLDMVVDGEKNRRDFPGLLGFGAGYDVTDKFYTEFNYTYWFQKGADWGTAGSDVSDMAGDAWSTGVALSYDITPVFEISAGTTYTKFEWDNMDAYYSANLGSLEVLYSDNWHVGSGFAWAFNDFMKLNFSLAQTLWDDETVNYASDLGVTPVATENATTVIAVGLDMSF